MVCGGIFGCVIAHGRALARKARARNMGPAIEKGAGGYPLAPFWLVLYLDRGFEGCGEIGAFP
jgi:hypothetical protein